MRVRILEAGRWAGAQHWQLDLEIRDSSQAIPASLHPSLFAPASQGGADSAQLQGD